MITFVLPTRDRPVMLASTLARLGRLTLTSEVVVVDNASTIPACVPRFLANGSSVRLIRQEVNTGAAARNIGVAASDASSRWVVMLDDDSYPIDDGFADVLERQPADVAAVSADIHVPRLCARESGGLPEVFIGCGAAIRREAFLSLGGYDPAFDYYAEEYDLAARILLHGSRVVFEREFRVVHEKDTARRDMDVIVSRLVRNNGWVTQRYAPEDQRRSEIRRIRRRYREFGRHESALAGYANGLRQLRASIQRERRAPMPQRIFDRFTGLSHARDALQVEFARRRFGSVGVVDAGKNCHVVLQAVAEFGVPIRELADAEVLVIGTLSPGPMLDAVERWIGSERRVIAPWMVPGARRVAWAGYPDIPDAA